MASNPLYAAAPPAPALVLYWPATDGGPWDTDASRFVESLTDRLGAFVTCVGSGPRSMALDDALSAARFMGCLSAVVVAPQGCRPPVEAATGGRRRSAVPAVGASARWTLEDVAVAYDRARERFETAA